MRLCEIPEEKLEKFRVIEGAAESHETQKREIRERDRLHRESKRAAANKPKQTVDLTVPNVLSDSNAKSNSGAELAPPAQPLQAHTGSVGAGSAVAGVVHQNHNHNNQGGQGAAVPSYPAVVLFV